MVEFRITPPPPDNQELETRLEIDANGHLRLMINGFLALWVDCKTRKLWMASHAENTGLEVDAKKNSQIVLAN